MRKSNVWLGLVGTIAAAGLVITPVGVASADADAGPDLRQLIKIRDLPGFAGYQTMSSDRHATSISTIPDASSCDEGELTTSRSFMGLLSEESYVSGAMGAVCAPGQEPVYLAGLETFEGGFVELPTPSPGDKIKTVITDDGEDTTVTVTNLATGDEVSASTPSVPKNYEVGIQTALDFPQVGGRTSFSKNRLDGAKLKAAHPAKVTFTDGASHTFKPSRLKRGVNFKVVTT